LVRNEFFFPEANVHTFFDKRLRSSMNGWSGRKLVLNIFRSRTRFSSYLGLIIGLFTNFKSMKHLKEYLEEPNDTSEYKLT
jgi:hypothetical protein